MINLRYHIVSITAVFLALGIGLAVGSTFLDRATVDTLNRQLDSLEGSLGDRGERITELETLLDEQDAQSSALDREGTALLTGVADDVPVVILTAEGADEADVAAAMDSLNAAGANVLGSWWVTDRMTLDDDAELSDMSEIVGVPSTDPARLRRAAVDAFADQLAAVAGGTPDEDTDIDGTGEDGTDGEDGTTTTTTTTTTTEPEGGGLLEEGVGAGDADGEAPVEVALTSPIEQLFARGFLAFQAAGEGPDEPRLVEGARTIVIGGSNDVADDLFLVPLVDHVVDLEDGVAAVVTSARDGDGELADVVSVIRQDEALRERITTVDTVEHFPGRAALVLSLLDLDEGMVGHYGVGEDATQLLPPARP